MQSNASLNLQSIFSISTSQDTNVQSVVQLEDTRRITSEHPFHCNHTSGNEQCGSYLCKQQTSDEKPVKAWYPLCRLCQQQQFKQPDRESSLKTSDHLMEVIQEAKEEEAETEPATPHSINQQSGRRLR